MATPASVHLVLVLHNHQPIGNFDSVFERAYQDSYLPFLDVFEPYDQLTIGLHTSGSLMEWLEANHPEYVDRLARLAEAGRIEIIGGAFYEPILTMIPSRDRIGQIESYSLWLESRLGTRPRGMWMPERVWEQSLTTDLAAAGIEYTLLDDFHFKRAGLTSDELVGPYLTEDNGHLLTIFPGSEPLRYLIPFSDPQASIDYLRDIAERRPGAVITFADDGEKFGTWPETKEHVYTHGWLRQFFDALVANASWLNVCTPSRAQAFSPPLGKVYLPDASYREMTEWALPADTISEREQLRHDLEAEGRWDRIAPLVAGGFWRNFKRKYPESNEMYARMQMVSRRLHAAGETTGSDATDRAEWLERARTELYRGQCNCSYWHGAFGGVYLPHLRNAIYHHLIAADNFLERAAGRATCAGATPWVEATADDYNFDAQQEICLANDRLVALVAPASGGQLYELDVREIRHNLLATMARRPEAYHRQVLSGPAEGGDVSSIHDRVIFKQEGLAERLQYDTHPRKSLVDHFYHADTTLDAVADGLASEEGDFVDGAFDARIRRSADRIQVQLTREGQAAGANIKITKGITLAAGSGDLTIAYLLENLPPDEPVHLAVEMNLAGLPADLDDRYFYDAQRSPLGHLGTRLDLSDVAALGLVDNWLGIDVRLTIDRPSGIWTFPIQTVSQSEGGFELVHQSVVVMPHWIVQADDQGRWSVTMTLAIDTSAAESRQNKPSAVAAV